MMDSILVADDDLVSVSAVPVPEKGGLPRW